MLRFRFHLHLLSVLKHCQSGESLDLLACIPLRCFSVEQHSGDVLVYKYPVRCTVCALLMVVPPGGAASFNCGAQNF